MTLDAMQGNVFFPQEQKKRGKGYRRTKYLKQIYLCVNCKNDMEGAVSRQTDRQRVERE